ncbi:MAG: Gnt-II system L-idonate transporter [Verrucomicrobiota bacterium]
MGVLAISVCLIIFLITVARVHAFFALSLAAFTVGILSRPGSLPGEKEGANHWVYAIDLATQGLGTTAGKIAVVIGLAAAIGMCLMESGAADKVVRRFLAVFGEKRAGFAICLSGYILSIPIFFDTFFMLLLPLAQALALRTGRNYVLYVLAICCGGVVTHSLVIPHPGPLAMADQLGIDAGLSVWVGIVVGIVPVLLTWQVVKWLNARVEVPLRETSAGSLEGLKRIAEQPESALPSFVASIAPVLVPIFLISFASTLAALPGLKASAPMFYAVFEFLGERNVALLIGVLMALAVLVKQKGTSAKEIQNLVGHPLSVAAVVILITSAGGAYGLMLRNIGVGDTVKELVAGRDINLVLLAWLMASVIRVAQGSATVSMMTTVALMSPLMADGSQMTFHPVYIFLAIGFGSMIMSWMNDSGFWVVSKLSGFTEGETLRTWTVVATVNSVAGISVVYVLSKLLPFAPG